MQYQDLIWHFSSGSSISKGTVTLRAFSSDKEYFRGAGQGSPEAFPVTLPLQAESRAVESKPARTSVLSSDEAERLGTVLFRCLPPAAVEPLLEFVGDPNRALRIKISSDLPACDDLPWECLCSGPGQFFALRPDVRIVRSIPVLVKTPPATVTPPLRVLLVITNPKDERLLDPWREMAAVTQRIQPPDYELHTVSEPTIEALLEVLRSVQPHIVHYIGHAGINRGEGNLILHDESHGTHWVCPSDLASALPLSVRLICLSTCFTAENYQLLGLPRFAHAAAELRLPTFVANQCATDEATVRSYWSAFYDELISGGANVNEACHRAALAVSQVSGPTAAWAAFSTVIRDGSGEVMKIAPATGISPARFAYEIQAQFASRLANELAEQVRALGESASKEIRSHLDQEVARVTDLCQSSEE